MDEKLKQIQKLLDAAEGNLHSARNLFREVVGSDSGKPLDVMGRAKELNIHEEGKIIEGVYNGEAMVGPDGKDYPVPANYASKSKLVEGDILKLTIAEDGSFIFKQINPVERTKTVGTLAYDNGNYTVNAEGKTYRVLQASVTYYKGEPGDSVTIIIPKEHEANWAAIENIIKKTDDPGVDANQPESAEPAEVKEEAPLTETPEEQTSEEVPTETEQEATPNIEFPENPESPRNLTQQDQQIADNLTKAEATPMESSTEHVVEPPAAPQNEKPDEGIKELEI